MAVTARVVLASAAAYAATGISDPATRDSFLAAICTNIPAGELPLENGGIAGRVSGSDSTIALVVAEWQRASLSSVGSRFSPGLLGWRMQGEELVIVADTAQEVPESAVAELIALSVNAADPEKAETAARAALRGPAWESFIEYAAGGTAASGFLFRGFPNPAALPALLLGVMNVLGRPFTETSETRELVQHIRPRPELAESQTSASSTVALLDHVENVGTENVPDWLGIGCVRNVEGAQTTVLNPVAAMYSMLDAGLVPEVSRLFEDRFWVRDPQSFGGERVKRHGMRVFSGAEEHPRVEADFADMGSDSASHEAAFQAFREHCGKVRQLICLGPGDLLLLRNTGSEPPDRFQQAMHGRGPFTAHRVAGQERHLLRVFARDHTL